jgi:antibiotic biosynthesis monooxygenase (ABM) superfamily enzyme
MVMSQQISWWGAAAWAVFIFAILKKKAWAIPLGIFAGVLSMLAGYPLGINNALFEVHRFSMFLPAPLISTALVIYLILPGTRKMIEKWSAS